MILRPNSIITLENNKKYILLNKTYYKREQYFLAMELNAKKEVIPSHAAILKGITKGETVAVEKVNDPQKIATITEQLKAQI